MEAHMTVDVAAVERELDRIQRDLTNTEVRASLLNLVVVSPTAPEAMQSAALTYLLGKRAARVIHIVRGDQEESSLEVSARCFVDRERKGVCFQEIVITNGKDAAGDAPGSWVPLLVRDIPTLVLWLDRLSDRENLLVHAQEQADKLVVDSELLVRWGDDQNTVISTLCRIASNGTAVSDFAFSRLRPVQKATAAAFDERLHLLREIRSVTLAGFTPMESRYFSLWLAERLGWSPPGEVYRDARGRAVAVECAAVRDGSQPAGDRGIEFGSYDGPTLSLALGPNGCADIDCADVTLFPVIVVMGDGEILLEEVDSMATDSLLQAALVIALPP